MASSPSIVCQKWMLASAALMVAAALAGSSRADERDNSTPPAGAAGDVALHGRVLLPDGKPAAGANVYWLQLKRAEPPAKSEIWWLKRATTDGNGRFRWTLEETDARLGPSNRPPIIAHQAGLGIGGMPVSRDDANTELTLRLVEDQPIRGRLIDTEGRPVAGASVMVVDAQSAPDGGLDQFLNAWQHQRLDARGMLVPGLSLSHSSSLPAGLAATTDDHGRFELTGAGAERLVTVNVTAPGYMSEAIRVVTRKGFDTQRYNSEANANTSPFMRARGRISQLMGPVFDRVLEAELVIRGNVFSGADRTPVSGGSVSSSGGGQSSVHAEIDSAGHFELHGARRGQDASIFVAARGGALLPRAVKLDLAAGQRFVDIDVELKQGIVVEGRVFDQTTGRGVKSGVTYVPLPQNHHAKLPGYDGAVWGFRSTDEEGRFRLLVVPGPGVLCAQVHGGGPTINGKKIKAYRQASFTEEESKLVPVTVNGDNRTFTRLGNSLVSLDLQNAVKVIDLKPGGGPVTYDLAIDPGKTAQITIEDDQGQPVTDAFVSGLADSWPYTFRIAEPSCVIYGLGADRPRRVCILHPERRLAASLTLTGDEAGPVTVRLAAPASITGRVLETEGEPLADAQVQVNYARKSASELLRFVELEKGRVTTDGDGRFQVDVVPGERFALDFRQGGHFYRAPLGDAQRTLKAGQMLELGDVKPKFIQ